jgi:hypothetical protein
MAHPANTPAAPVAEFTRVACVKLPGTDKGAFAFPSPSTSAVSGYIMVNITSLEDGMENLTMDAACISKRFMNSSIALKA